MAGAWGQLLAGADALAGESTYLYDLADVGRQVLCLMYPVKYRRHWPLQSQLLRGHIHLRSADMHPTLNMLRAHL